MFQGNEFLGSAVRIMMSRTFNSIFAGSLSWKKYEGNFWKYLQIGVMKNLWVQYFSDPAGKSVVIIGLFVQAQWLKALKSEDQH